MRHHVSRFTFHVSRFTYETHYYFSLPKSPASRAARVERAYCQHAWLYDDREVAVSRRPLHGGRLDDHGWPGQSHLSVGAILQHPGDGIRNRFPAVYFRRCDGIRDRGPPEPGSKE